MIPTVLLVDDEPDFEHLVLQRFRRAIREGAIRFEYAHDGLDALERLAAGLVCDMVITDINMPRMDGLTLLGHLQEGEPRPATIIVSAYGDMANIRTAMNRGATDFLTKPIDLADLEATIAKTLATVAELRKLKEAHEAAERARMAMSRYFSPALARELATDPRLVHPGGERRPVTFLFTDISDFTALVETTDPADVAALLNAYIDGVTGIVFDHDGTVVKVVGDAVHAMFGAPLDQPDHPRRAVECALAIDAFARGFEAGQRVAGIPLGATRIGVNTGPAIVGNFGGTRFFDYTAHGDAINVAARLESVNKHFGTRVCVSGTTAGAIEDFCGRPIGELVLKGRTAPIAAFEPLFPATCADPASQAYLVAYDFLAAGKPAEARRAFAALVGAVEDDPLALFHLRRLLAGENGSTIVLPEK